MVLGWVVLRGGTTNLKYGFDAAIACNGLLLLLSSWRTSGDGAQVLQAVDLCERRLTASKRKCNGVRHNYAAIRGAAPSYVHSQCYTMVRTQGAMAPKGEPHGVMFAYVLL